MKARRYVAASALVAALGLPSAARAQQRFTHVEYVAGTPRLTEAGDVTLVLAAEELRVEQSVYGKHGRSLQTAFAIPLANIVMVGASGERDAGTSLLTSLPAPNDHREYVTVTLEVDARLGVDILTGSDDPIGGWVSRGYHQKVPSTTLIARGRCQGKSSYISRIHVGPAR